VDYGVTDAHYETVGGALLWTLEKGLGAAFSVEVRGAWLAAYHVLASAMKEGAAQAEQNSEAAMRLPACAAGAQS
jgi:hemoglobin-like flavoprotein